MKKRLQLYGLSMLIGLTGAVSPVFATDDATTMKELFAKGIFEGSLKSYYFTQTFDGTGKNDSNIWVNGGDLKYTTGTFCGLQLGAKLQASCREHRR